MQDANNFIRVALRDNGVIGIIEIQQGMTLSEARDSIACHVGNVPSDFHYISVNNALISIEQEDSTTIQSFYPCIQIQGKLDDIAEVTDAIAHETPERTILDPLEAHMTEILQVNANVSTNMDYISSICDGPKIIDSCVDSDATSRRRGRSCTSKYRNESGNKVNVEEELWQIYIYYCLRGGNRGLECLKVRQFYQFLKDCHLLESVSNVSQFKLLQVFQSSKKKDNALYELGYNQFLDALLSIALLRVKNYNVTTLAGYDSHNNNVNTQRWHQQTEDEFRHLVFDLILPSASRWRSEEWSSMNGRLRAPEVLSFLTKYVSSLIEIFMFYARSCRINPVTSVKEWYMSHSHYQRFVNDFMFLDIHLSGNTCSQIYFAACSSSPLFILKRESDSIPYQDKDEIAATNQYDSSRGLLEGIEINAAYTFARLHEKKHCMGFSAFLDSLGRAGILAYSSTRSQKDTLTLLKAIFHHMCQCLTHARVMELIERHGKSCVHATKFYLGTVAFTSKHLSMWKSEGTPDYVNSSDFTRIHTGSKNRKQVDHIACKNTKKKLHDKRLELDHPGKAMLERISKKALLAKMN